MTDEAKIKELAERIRAGSTQEERERWASAQPPLADALDPADADDE